MKIAQFFKQVDAQLVGGKVKALYEGVHHIIAEMVDGSPQLTQAGENIKQGLELAASAAGPAVETAADIAIAGAVKDPALAAIAGQAANTLIDEAAAKVFPTSEGVDASTAPPRPIKKAKQ